MRPGFGCRSPFAAMNPAFWIWTGTNFSLHGGKVVASFTTTRHGSFSSPATQQAIDVPLNFRVKFARSILPWLLSRMSCPKIASRGISATSIGCGIGSPENTTVISAIPEISIDAPDTPVMLVSTGLSAGRFLTGILWYVSGDIMLTEAPVSTKKWTGSPPMLPVVKIPVPHCSLPSSCVSSSTSCSWSLVVMDTW